MWKMRKAGKQERIPKTMKITFEAVPNDGL
jgi:hypothetical protein